MSIQFTAPDSINSTSALARHLGLSRWTISRVLNNHPGVKDETRERVMKAIEELGFEPNRMARGLRGAPSRLIGVCFQQLEAPILARKNAVLQKHLRAHDYRGIFELTDGDQNLEATIIRHFLSVNVDGIVLVGSLLREEDPVVEQLLSAGMPVVAVDPIHSLPFPQVLLSRQNAMASKLQHLFELGHRKFAVLGVASDDLYRESRLAGLKDACAKNGVNYDRDIIPLDLAGYNCQDYAYGAALARKLLELKDRPTGLIALNDRIAIGAMRTLQEAGFDIPLHFSVVGFDNLEMSAWAHPALTTIDQRVENLMSTATRTLLQAISQDGEGQAAQVWIEPLLVERASTARPFQFAKVSR